MKKIIAFITLTLTACYSYSQLLDEYDFLSIDDTTTGYCYTDIASYNWDTLYLSTSRVPRINPLDTVVLCLRTPEFPKFTMPVNGQVISEFGWRGRRIHTGIDIKLNKGDSVYCSFDGVVRISRYFSGYGNLVVVRHYNGIETVYAHLSKRLVEVNDTVKCGQVLGLGGRTGRATTEHLHFETRYKEQPFNPRLIIDFNDQKLATDTIVLTHDSFKFTKKTRSHSLAHANTKVQSGSKIHIIQKGDTLYSLARRYGTTVKDICQANDISENKILSVGQRIRIP